VNRHEEGLPLRVHLLAAGLVALLALGGILGWLFATDRIFAGTNSVGPRFLALSVGAHKQLCVKGLELPGSARAVRLRLQPDDGTTRLALHVAARGSEQISHATAPGKLIEDVDFPIRATHRSARVRLCLDTPSLLSMAGQPSGLDPNTTVDGKPVGAKVSVWFLHGSARSVATSLADAPLRAALFRAGWVGPWTYVLLPFVLVLLWLAGLRLLLRRGA
jgi:hypothetical protein